MKDNEGGKTPRTRERMEMYEFIEGGNI